MFVLKLSYVTKYCLGMVYLVCIVTLNLSMCIVALKILPHLPVTCVIFLDESLGSGVSCSPTCTYILFINME